MERDDLRAELADIDVDHGDARAERDELHREAYDDVVVDPTEPWEAKVDAAGFDFSANASISWDGRKRESSELIDKQPGDRRRVVRTLASMAHPSAGHWNNRAIAETYLERLDAAQTSFKAAIACAQPETDVTRARSNLGRLKKLAAE